MKFTWKRRRAYRKWLGRRIAESLSRNRTSVGFLFGGLAATGIVMVLGTWFIQYMLIPTMAEITEKPITLIDPLLWAVSFTLLFVGYFGWMMFEMWLKYGPWAKPEGQR